MQRLFSTFADGPPGIGLLLQRLLTGGALLYSLATPPAGNVGAPQLIASIAGLFLIVGFSTPVAGVVAACAEIWIAFVASSHASLPAALAILSLTLALIGPGEWSIDARLYGRKHIVSPRP